MFFEPYKKNYYRFPSSKSLAKMDKRLYFPERPIHARDDSNYNRPSNSYMSEKEHSYDIK